jgi:aldehyde:ferredoxin oxidoreductase
MWLKWIKGENGGFFTSDDFQKAAELFWGGRIAADYTTFEGKALSAKMIQDRTYAKESLVLCDFSWPMIWAKNSKSHVGDPTLESKIFSAITGKQTDEQGLNRMGERIFNLQRAILLRQGWQAKKDDVILEYLYTEPLKPGEVFYDIEGRVPGKDGEVVAKTGAIIDRKEFERARSEYYRLRGWDVESGLPSRAGLEDLHLKYIADDLEKREILA